MAFGRGETIGTAYIRILADGSGLDRSVAAEMRKAEPVIRAEGQRHGEDYTEAFNEGVRDNRDWLKTVDENLRAVSARMNAGAEVMGDDAQEALATKFANRLNKNPKFKTAAQELGRRMVADIVDGMNRGRKLSDIDLESQFGPLLARAVAGFDADSKKAIADAQKASEKLARESIAMRTRFAQDFRQTSREISTEIGLIVGRSQGAIREANKALGETDKIIKATNKAIDTLDSEHLRSGIRDLNKDISAWGQGVVKTGRELEEFTRRIATWRSGLDRSHPDFDALSRDLDVMGARLLTINSRLKTATNSSNTFWQNLANSKPRNDFLNIITSVVGGLGNFGDMIGKQLPKFLGLSEDAFGGIIPKITAVSSTVVVLVGLLGPLVAGIAGLGGAIIALGSSLALAAAGGLAVFTGGLIAAGGALGVLILALTSFHQSGVSADFKDALSGLTDQVRQWQALSAAGVMGGLQTALPAITAGMEQLSGTIGGIALALGDTIEGFGKVVSSPAFHTFTQVLAVQLPEIVALFGQAFNNAFKGMLGVIEAVLPATQDFAGWLAGITGDFAEFSNSVSGQNKLATFFSAAETSARALGGLIGSVASALGRLIMAAAPSGDTLINDLTEQVTKLGDWLEAHPDAVADFFGDSVKIAEALGSAILAVVGAIGKLNTDANRAAFINITNAAADLVDIIGDVLDAVSRGVAPVVEMLTRLLALVLPMIDYLAQLSEGFLTVFGAIGGGLVTLGLALKAFTLLKGAWAGLLRILGPFARLLVKAFTNRSVLIVGALATAMDGLQEKSLNAKGVIETLGGAFAAGFLVGGPAGGVVGVTLGAIALGFKHVSSEADNFAASSGKLNESLKTLVSTGEELQTATGAPDFTAYAAALEGAHRDLEKFTTDQNALVAEAEHPSGWLGMFRSVKDMAVFDWNRILNGDQAQEASDQILAAAQDLGTALDQWSQINNLLKGLPSDSLSGAINNVQDLQTVVDQVVPVLQDAGLSIKDINTLLATPAGRVELVQNFKDAIQSSDSLEGRTDALVDALSNVENGLVDTAEGARDLQSALSDLISPKLDLSAQLDQWNHDLRHLGESLDDHSHALVGNNDAAEKNRAAIRALVTQDLSLLDAQAKAGASADKLRGNFAKYRDQILDVGKANDLNAEQLRKYLIQLGLTPKLVSTLLKSNAKDAKGEVDGYADSLHAIPLHVESTVAVDGLYDANTGVLQLKQNLEDIDGINADASVTITRINKVLNQLGAGALTAKGGLFDTPQLRIIGEAGPEAVVPLSKPLNEVDPSVRWLAALAHGQAVKQLIGAPPTARAGIDVGGITIITPTKDPGAVAQETLNRLAASTYF